MAKKKTDEFASEMPQVATPEIPQDISSAHSAVMKYTRSDLWLKIGKRTIVIALAILIAIFLITRIFTDNDLPAGAFDPDSTVSVTNGIDGEKGDKGDPGADGKDGEDGADGQDGLDGADGQKGDKGDRGPQGPQGPAGPAGGGEGTSSEVYQNGNFVIALDNPKKGIALSETKGFTYPTAQLNALSLENCWNITYSDIPENIDNEYGGTKNGKDYFAYTFFLKNTSPDQVSLDYNFKLTLKEDRTGSVEAIRFQVYEDGRSTIYGADRKEFPGQVEPFACDKAFTGDVNLLDYNVKNFAYNAVKRFTIVMWYEGNDPECVNSILPAAIDLSMHFEVLE